MSELIKISLGSHTSVGAGWAVEGQAGAPTAMAVVRGTGSVSATVVVQGSNDGTAWRPLVTLSPSGDDVAASSGSWAGDYALLRVDVIQIADGAEVSAVVTVDQTSTTPSAGQGGAAQLLQRRREQAKRAASMPATNQAPLWASGAVITTTSVVRLSTGELLVATTGGTCGTVEPTITPAVAPAAITDGSVTWWPLQEHSRTPSAELPPVTVTDNAGNSTLNLLNFLQNAELFEQASAPNLHLVAGTGSTTRNSAWSIIDGSTLDNGFGANGRRGTFRTIAFMSESDVFDIGYFSSNAGSVGDRLLIDIDGVSVFEAPFVPGAVGASRHLRLHVAGGLRDRVVRVSCSGRLNLTYVGVPSGRVISPPNQRGLTSVFLSDSFGDTEQPTLNSVQHDLLPRVSRGLGFPNCVAACVGGTSYSVSNANGAKSALDVMTLTDFSAFGANVYIFAHGYNATTNGTAPAAEASAASACWDIAHSAAPEAPILAVGPWCARPGWTEQTAAMRDALKSAFLGRGERGAFVDPLDGSVTLADGTVITDAGQAWINTTNAAWALPPAGGGFDGAHVSIAGRAYLESRLIASCDAALLALGM